MKTIGMSLSAALLSLAAIANVNAVECVNGVHRAGCVGPHGAAGVHKGGAMTGRHAVVVEQPKAVVVRPHENECAHVNGRVVCR